MKLNDPALAHGATEMSPEDALHALLEKKEQHTIQHFLYKGRLFEFRRASKQSFWFRIALCAYEEGYPRSWVQPDASAGDITPVHCVWQPKIKLSYESQMNRLGKLLRLNREIQVGEEVFDQNVYVSTEAPDELVTRVLAVAKTRRAMMDCLEKFDSVEIFGEVYPLSVRYNGVVLAGTERAAMVRQNVDLLVEIAQRLPSLEVAHAGEHPVLRSSKIALFAALYTPVAVILCLIMDQFWPTFGDAHLVQGLSAGALVGLLLLILLFYSVRGFGNSLFCFTFGAACLMVSSPMTGVVLGTGVNVLGPSSVETQEMRVEAKIKRDKGQGKSFLYFLKLAPQEGTLEPTDFQVSASAWSRAREGQSVRVDVGHGALGWTWLEKMSIP